MYPLATVYPDPWGHYQNSQTFGTVYIQSTITEPSFSFVLHITSEKLRDKGFMYPKTTCVSPPLGALSKFRNLWHNLHLDGNY